MPDLGLDVLLKGNNMIRLLQGMWVALQISLISIVISMPLGILVGALMTMKNKIVRAIFRIYLEIIRIMPQLVLLFIVYFWKYESIWMEFVGEVACNYRICTVGNRRNGRFGKRSADQYSKASIREQ